MKIAMLNTSDGKGGAAVAARRLQEALTARGVGVTMIVRDKTTDERNVISVNTGWLQRKINRFRFLWERGIIFLNNGLTRKYLFAVSIADTGTDVSQLPEIQEADIIHLHWINQGFLSLRGLQKLLALGKPVVWTLHDMWPATGICHHAWTCERYKTTCGACPFLHSTRKNDLSRRIQRKKVKIYTLGLQLVTVSRWLQEKCEAGALTRHLPVRSIPNSIDTDLFSPGDPAEARRRLGIPAGKKVLVMGAARIDDPIKGFSLLKAALEKLPEKTRENMLLVLFGAFRDEALLKNFPVAVDWRGSVSGTETLRDLYRAADAAVNSSHYETFGQTLSEAMACGCPAVSFGNSGQRGIIDHRHNGYLARYPDPADLTRGIEWVLNHPDPAALAENARKKVLDTFTTDRISAQYLALYRSLLGQ